MKTLTNKEKVKILKKAKEHLTNSLRISRLYKCMCECMAEIINVWSFFEYYSMAEIQKMFDMHLVKPENAKSYWWEFNESGYLSRQKAFDILIKHFTNLK